MKTITKLCLAGVAFGSMAVTSLSASAADIPATATYTLAALPAAVTVSNAQAVAFGTRYIPADGGDAATFTIDPTGTGDGQGSITIDNGVPTAQYTLTLGAAACPAADSNAVTFTPTAAHNTNAVADGATFAYIGGATTLSLGGTLTVPAGAAVGAGTCTFQVTLVNAAS